MVKIIDDIDNVYKNPCLVLRKLNNRWTLLVVEPPNRRCDKKNWADRGKKTERGGEFFCRDLKEIDWTKKVRTSLWFSRKICSIRFLIHQEKWCGTADLIRDGERAHKNNKINRWSGLVLMMLRFIGSVY